MATNKFGHVEGGFLLFGHGFTCLSVVLGSNPTAFAAVNGYSWRQNRCMAFYRVFGGKVARLCGLGLEIALRAF